MGLSSGRILQTILERVYTAEFQLPSAAKQPIELADGPGLLADLQTEPLAYAAALVMLDEINVSHQVVQDDPSVLSGYIHGIIHRREGDFSNARYWFNRAKGVVDQDLTGRITTQSERAHRMGFDLDAEVMKLIRDEWSAVLLQFE